MAGIGITLHFTFNPRTHNRDPDYRLLSEEGIQLERTHNKLHVNLLKPTGHVRHQQFNIQQLYVLPTLYLCVLYLSENKY